jgi:hypothetical protein
MEEQLMEADKDRLMSDEDRELTLSEIMEGAEQAGRESQIELYTCYTCCNWKHCCYAFDLYNTAGDCLAMK